MGVLALMVIASFVLGLFLQRAASRSLPEKPGWLRFKALALLVVPLGAAINSGVQGYFLWQLSAAIWLVTAFFYALGCFMGGI